MRVGLLKDWIIADAIPRTLDFLTRPCWSIMAMNSFLVLLSTYSLPVFSESQVSQYPFFLVASIRFSNSKTRH